MNHDLKIEVEDENGLEVQDAPVAVGRQSGNELTFAKFMEMESSAFDKVLNLSHSLDEKKRTISLNATYKEFEQAGDKVRGVYLGERTIRVKDQVTEDLKDLSAVAWLDKGETYLNAGVSLVNEMLSSGIPAGAPIEIEFLGTKKAGAGNVKLYKIYLLEIEA
jgi:hypothetical protein